jgi:hypothetical protein
MLAATMTSVVKLTVVLARQAASTAAGEGVDVTDSAVE